jgi:hypothetical protein
MTLEEIVKQLKDAQTVTAAQTLRHETRLKEHQQWLEDNELADVKHREKMAELDDYITKIAAAQLVNEQKMVELKDALKRFLERGGNGQH